MKISLILPFFLLFLGKALAQSPVGVWKTVDDKSGKNKGQIEFFQKDGMLFGKIVKISNDTLNHICTMCPGERNGKRMFGMVIMENLRFQDGFWRDGRVLNPKNGKWYELRIWLEDGNPNVLILRAYWGFLYKTQRWYRIS